MKHRSPPQRSLRLKNLLKTTSMLAPKRWRTPRMSDPILSAELLPEPELEFATGQQIEHPAAGLGLFGPVDSSGIEKPNRISYAVIGSPDGIAGFGAFATRLNSPIDPPPE